MTTSVWSAEVQAAIERARVAGTREVLVGDKTVRILTPFPSPSDWRDRWIYFLLVDRFNNPQAGPRRSWEGEISEFQGGTLEGVRARRAQAAKGASSA